MRPSDAANKNVTWKSDDTSVAVVDATGKVVALKAGSATVTATTVDGGFTATCAVTVTNKVIAVTAVELNKATLELVIGKEETLTATVTPENATNKNVTWKSSKTDVATVDNNGKVTAIAEGNAKITVITKDGGKEANCLVTVSAASVAVEEVILNKTSLSLMEGFSETLTATISPLTATNKNVTWMSDKPAVATVDDSGKVTAVKEGTATITVTTEDGGKTASCSVTVTKLVVAVTSVSLNKSSLTLYVGSSETLTATITPSDADNKNVTWSSTEPSAASVDGNGTVTALKEGTTTIKVVTEDGAKTAECTVTVKKIAVTGVTVSPKSLILATADAAKNLTATISPSNATYKNIAWSSSDETVATVDKNGKVTPLKEGTATITATSEDDSTRKGTCSVTVGKDVTSEFDATFAQVLQTKGYVADATRILDAEAANVTYLNVSNQSLTSLKGIEYFMNLETLDISSNINMTTLDLSHNTKLKALVVNSTYLTTFDLSKNTELKTLNAYGNKLTSLDLSKNTKLTYLNVSENQLTSIDVSHNTELTDLQFGTNSLTSIDISNNTKLTHFYCKYNPGNEENNFIVKVWSSFPDTPPTEFTTGTWTNNGNTITVVYQK